ncbi:MAG: tetratricopeptide repeat protein [Xanthomonadales bacterium]|nr:tetratricopeptide repeat protein [Xanthomonadales bacterium]
MSFFAELKRRNVIRVAVLYVVSSWLILQMGDLLFDLMGLPDWALRIVLGILILGFPAALIFSWIFELTPEGIKLEKEIDRSQSVTPDTGRKLNLVTIVVVLLGVGVIAADRWIQPNPAREVPGAVETEATQPEPEGPISSIAVLPFEDFSQTKDQEYLATGIADTVLHSLAQVDGLRVAARTSSFKLAEENADIRTVGQRLNVGAVLEGSVQKAGDQLRIIAQLVRTGDEFHLWSQTFDRPAGDIFAIQDEIAAAVLAALRADESVDEITTVERTDPETYELFLKGRHLWQERTNDSTRRAMELLREVVRHDPDYAAGHSELAVALLMSAWYGGGNEDAVRDLADEQARRALELDPNDAMAYAVLGSSALDRDDWPTGIEYLRKSLEINGNDPTVHTWMANALTSGAQFKEAQFHLERAVELDPLDLNARSTLAGYLANIGGELERAQAVVEETLAIAPDSPQAWEAAGNLYFGQGLLAKAAMADFKRLQLDPGSASPYYGMRSRTFSLGLPEAALGWQKLVVQFNRSASRWCSPYLLARELAEAYLECARTALEQGDGEEADLISDLGNALMINGRYEDALTQLLKARELSSMNQTELLGYREHMDLARIIWLRRELGRGETDALVAEMQESAEFVARQSPVIANWPLAIAALVAGDEEKAARLIAELLERVTGSIVYRAYHEVRRYPMFAKVREHPVLQRAMKGIEDRLAGEVDKLRREGDPRILEPPDDPAELVSASERI